MKEIRHRIYARDYVGLWGYMLLKFFFCAIPWQAGYFIAAVASEILYRTAKANRCFIEGNLRAAFEFDEETVKKYTRRIFRFFCYNLVDFVRFGKFNEKWFKKNVEVIGLENLREASRRSRGIIAIGLHMGNWELGSYIPTLCGVTVNGIWASHKNPKLEEFFLKPRLEKGIKVILTGGALKKALEALTANELVCFVVDHSYNKKGVEMQFLGRKAIIPAGAALAAIKSGAAILPMIPVRQGGLRYKLYFGKRVDYSLTGDSEKDTREIMQKCIKALEPYVKENPDQWLLFRKYYIE